MIIKIAATVFALFAWYKAYQHYRQQRTNFKELAFWTLIWLGVGIVVFIPGKTHLLARMIGMGRGFDALMFVSMLAVFYAIYKMFARQRRMEHEITELVRAIAIEKPIQNHMNEFHLQSTVVSGPADIEGSDHE